MVSSPTGDGVQPGGERGVAESPIVPPDDQPHPLGGATPARRRRTRSRGVSRQGDEWVWRGL